MAAVHDPEQANINRLLNADVYHVPSDEERARVEAGVPGACEGHAAANDDMRPRGERHPTRGRIGADCGRHESLSARPAAHVG